MHVKSKKVEKNNNNKNIQLKAITRYLMTDIEKKFMLSNILS